MDCFESLETGNVAYKVTFVDGRKDNDWQMQQIKAFIERGVDVMIVELVKYSSAAQVTQLADAANIPVVYFLVRPDEEDMDALSSICYVGWNIPQSGTCQGEIITNLPDRGDINGDGIVSYVMIMGEPEDFLTWPRTESVVKALTDAGIEVEELVTDYGYWEDIKGCTIMANALDKYGEKIEVVFCNNDAMALGALDAIRRANRIVGEDIYLVGIDALYEALNAVKNGEMTGTVFDDYPSQARAAVDAAINYLDGRENDKYILIDYVPVTKGWIHPAWG